MAVEINLNDVASATDLSSHELDVNNPHAVTKTQVGLSDADNTSDVNKPISSATQTALNGKEDLSNKQTDLTPSATKYPTVNAVNTGLSGKLNDIEIDSTPTASSTNLVTSGGVFTGLGTKENSLPSMVGNSLKVLRVNAAETGKEWANTFKWTLDFDGVLTGDIYPNFAGTISSVTNLVASPTTTILKNGSPYTFGDSFLIADKITVDVTIDSVIDLNFTIS